MQAGRADENLVSSQGYLLTASDRVFMDVYSTKQCKGIKEQRPAPGLGLMKMDVGIEVSPERGVLNCPVSAAYF